MRSIVLVILVLGLSINIMPQEKLTLEKAIGIALHKNSTLLKNTDQIQGYESSVQAAYGNFLPTLGFNASWDWNKSDTKGIGTVNINGVPVPILSSTEISRNYSGALYSNWTLFDGLSNIATLTQSKNNLESAQLTLKRVKQDIVYQT